MASGLSSHFVRRLSDLSSYRMRDVVSEQTLEVLVLVEGKAIVGLKSNKLSLLVVMGL